MYVCLCLCNSEDILCKHTPHSSRPYSNGLKGMLLGTRTMECDTGSIIGEGRILGLLWDRSQSNVLRNLGNY